VDKAVSLLLAFGEQASTGVGVSELARRAELSKSTAFRVLGLLARNGVVERIGREYRLGARLHELGSHVYSTDHDRVRDQMTPFVTDLYERTHETVHLAALHGTDVVYLAKLYGHRRVPSPSRVGGRVPAHATAVGKALLAHEPEMLDAVLAAGLPAITPSTISDPSVLLDQLAAVRRTGVAHDLEEMRSGLFCVAMPILDSTGRPVAALSVSAGAHVDLRRIEATLRQVGAEAARYCARRPARL
jgi:DNA-binding IclR family transcriptional regulator